MSPRTRASQRSRLPGAIWALGFVSLLMDVSSEMIHSLLPVFLVSSLGASAFAVGLIEGFAEATALIVDASVAIKWFIDEPGADAARRLCETSRTFSRRI